MTITKWVFLYRLMIFFFSNKPSWTISCLQLLFFFWNSNHFFWRKGEIMTHNFDIVCNNSSKFIWYSLCLRRAETKDKDSDMDVIYAHVYFSEVKTFAVAEKRTESCPRCQCSGLQYFLTPSVHLITSTLKFLSRRYIDESFSKPILEVLLYTNCNGSNTKNNSC